MKILVVVANFIPEIGSAAHLYFDLCKSFVSMGHEVDVICSYPRSFNLSGEDREREFPKEEKIEGITVYRCSHPAERDNLLVRGLEHFYIPLYYYRRYLEIGKKYDVCLMYIPPLPLYYLARLIKRHDGTPSVLNFQDFHPQELTDVGVLRNPLVIKILKFIESRAYSHADRITVLSSGGLKYVQDRGADSKKVVHVFNSVDLSEFDALLEKRDLKSKLGLEDKTIVSYAGILSPYQGIDNILDVALSLLDRPDLVFIIAGDGSERDRIEKRIENEGIKNAKMLGLLPRDEYFNLVNSSDISLVSLDDRMLAPCLPGKLVNLMACNQPIIGIVSDLSETAAVIRKAGCGLVVKPGDIEMIRTAVLTLADDAATRKDMGARGRLFLEDNMDLKKNSTMYEEIFRSLLMNDATIN